MCDVVNYILRDDDVWIRNALNRDHFRLRVGPRVRLRVNRQRPKSDDDDDDLDDALDV